MHYYLKLPLKMILAISSNSDPDLIYSLAINCLNSNTTKSKVDLVTN